MSTITNLSSQQLRHVADLKEKIDVLQHELDRLLSGTAPSRPAGGRRFTMSAAARARIAAAQRARWAKARGGRAAKRVHKPKRQMSAAARAKIAAAARARWAKAKAAGRTRL